MSDENKRSGNGDESLLFGVRFKEIRKKLGIKQKELASSLNISNSYLSEIEKGRKQPSLKVLKNLYDRYGISPHWMIVNRGEMTNGEYKTDLLEELEFGEYSSIVKDMVKYMSQSPFFLAYMISQYIKAFNENEDAIKIDIEKNKDRIPKN